MKNKNGRHVEQDVYRGLSEHDVDRLARPSKRELADDRDARKLVRRWMKPGKVKRLGPVWVNYTKEAECEHPHG